MPTTTWYLDIQDDQFPFELPPDAEGRRVYAFNITASKVPSATFIEEVVHFISSNGVTAQVLIGSAAVPSGDGPFITVKGTGGVRGLRVHNRVTPAVERPGAQILVRAKSSSAAKLLTYRLYRLLTEVRNQSLTVPEWALV